MEGENKLFCPGKVSHPPVQAQGREREAAWCPADLWSDAEQLLHDTGG